MMRVFQSVFNSLADAKHQAQLYEASQVGVSPNASESEDESRFSWWEIHKLHKEDKQQQIPPSLEKKGMLSIDRTLPNFSRGLTQVEATAGKLPSLYHSGSNLSYCEKRALRVEFYKSLYEQVLSLDEEPNRKRSRKEEKAYLLQKLDIPRENAYHFAVVIFSSGPGNPDHKQRQNEWQCLKRATQNLVSTGTHVRLLYDIDDDSSADHYVLLCRVGEAALDRMDIDMTFNLWLQSCTGPLVFDTSSKRSYAQETSLAEMVIRLEADIHEGEHGVLRVMPINCCQYERRFMVLFLKKLNFLNLCIPSTRTKSYADISQELERENQLLEVAIDTVENKQDDFVQLSFVPPSLQSSPALCTVPSPALPSPLPSPPLGSSVQSSQNDNSQDNLSSHTFDLSEQDSDVRSFQFHSNEIKQRLKTRRGSDTFVVNPLIIDSVLDSSSNPASSRGNSPLTSARTSCGSSRKSSRRNSLADVISDVTAGQRLWSKLKAHQAKIRQDREDWTKKGSFPALPDHHRRLQPPRPSASLSISQTSEASRTSQTSQTLEAPLSSSTALLRARSHSQSYSTFSAEENDNQDSRAVNKTSDSAGHSQMEQPETSIDSKEDEEEEWWPGYSKVQTCHISLDDLAKQEDFDQNNLDDDFFIYELNDHHGNKVAFYFAFIHYYTKWLIGPALLGAIISLASIVGMIDNRVYGILVACFGFLISALWSPLWIQAWKKKTMELNMIWSDFRATSIVHSDLEDYQGLPYPNPSYDPSRRGFTKLTQEELQVIQETLTEDEIIDQEEKARRPITCLIIVFTLVMILVMFVIVLFVVSIYLKTASIPPCSSNPTDSTSSATTTASLSSSYALELEKLLHVTCLTTTERTIIHIVEALILTFVVNVLFQRLLNRVAKKATDLENHRTENYHERSLVRKLFIFNWFSLYFWFFILAFVIVPFGWRWNDWVKKHVGSFWSFDPDKTNFTLQSAFVIPLVVTQFLNLFVETIVPYVLSRTVLSNRKHGFTLRTSNGANIHDNHTHISPLNRDGSRNEKYTRSIRANKLAAKLSKACRGVIHGLSCEPTEAQIKIDSESGSNFGSIIAVPDCGTGQQTYADIIATSNCPTYSNRKDYNDMLLQYGYVVMFSAVWPWIPFCAMINNLLEIRGDLFTLFYSSRPPVPQHATGMGAWSTSMMVINFVGLVVTSAVICVSSGGLDWMFPSCEPQIGNGKMGPDASCFSSQLDRFGMAFVFENVGLLCQLLIFFSISTIPTWITGRVRVFRQSAMRLIYGED